MAVFYWEDAIVAVAFMAGKALNNGSGQITLLTNPYLRNGFIAEVAIGTLSGSTPTRPQISIILDGVAKRTPYSVAALFRTLTYYMYAFTPEKPLRL
jgi:hypothetical protein